MSYDYDLFVIGGGSGGVRCARIAAGHGARVGIAEERHWGGTCVNVGCVPKKMMVQAAEYGAMAEDSRGFGWQAERDAHDWPTLLGAIDTEIARLNGIYRQLLSGSGVTCHEARASFVDAHTLDVGGRQITAERIVIAVGGHPVVQPHIEGWQHGIVSDAAFALPHMPRRVVLIGGGYIGVEFANIFNGLGAEVDLVFRQHLPLRGFDHDIREAVAGAMTTAGIRLHPTSIVHRLRKSGDVISVELSSGRTLEADLAFFAVGRVPNTAKLGLKDAGIETADDGAVVVNDEQATSQANVFAIGDVSNKLNLTPVAIAEGHHLADRLFAAAPPRSWSLDQVATAVFSAPPIATIGLTEEQAAARGAADIYMTQFTPMRHRLSGRAGRQTLMKLVVDHADQTILGAHMLGEDAPEMMQGLATAIVAGATKTDLDRTVGIHPTSAEEWVTLRTRTRVVGQGDMSG